MPISESVGKLSFITWSKAACEESPEDYSTYQGLKNINGNDFSYYINNFKDVIAISESVSGHSDYENFSHVFRIIHSNYCYRIEYSRKTNTSQTHPENILMPEVINQILSTFKFTK